LMLLIPREALAGAKVIEPLFRFIVLSPMVNVPTLYDVEANVVRFWARRNLLPSFKTNEDNIEHP